MVNVLSDQNLKVDLDLQQAGGHPSVEVVVHHHGASEVGLSIQHDNRPLDVLTAIMIAVPMDSSRLFTLWGTATSLCINRPLTTRGSV